MEKTLSLELLLLNDLLNTKTIDKDLYDRAVTKITNMMNAVPTEQPRTAATA